MKRRKKTISHNFCETSWCSFRWTFNLVNSNLTYQDKTQPSNWNQQAEVPSKHSYIENGIPYSLWNSFSLSLPVMGSQKQRNTKSIWKTEHSKIAFKNRYEREDLHPLYKNLKIIKFQDLLRLNNCLFMCQLEQNVKLAETFPGLTYTKENHNYNTSARKNLLDIPLCQTFTYGTQSSCKYQFIYLFIYLFI